jgi:hypothetical protein
VCLHADGMDPEEPTFTPGRADVPLREKRLDRLQPAANVRRRVGLHRDDADRGRDDLVHRVVY